MLSETSMTTTPVEPGGRKLRSRTSRLRAEAAAAASSATAPPASTMRRASARRLAQRRALRSVLDTACLRLRRRRICSLLPLGLFRLIRLEQRELRSNAVGEPARLGERRRLLGPRHHPRPAGERELLAS